MAFVRCHRARNDRNFWEAAERTFRIPAPASTADSGPAPGGRSTARRPVRYLASVTTFRIQPINVRTRNG